MSYIISSTTEILSTEDNILADLLPSIIVLKILSPKGSKYLRVSEISYIYWQNLG